MNAETLMEYEAPVPGPDGRPYAARACGRERDDGSWEGWLEFESDDELVFRTPRETTQPDKNDLLYWAAGLSAVYLEGALVRAVEPPRRIQIVEPAPPAFDGPAPAFEVEVHGTDALAETNAAMAAADPVLDPIAVYASGEGVLRRRLGALASWHLRNIARAYHVVADPEELAKSELIEAIVAAARASAPSAAR